MHRSLQSLPSCCSLESLKESTPFRIPPWDKTSTEFYFARSHAILTKRHPALYSVNELNDKSLNDFSDSMVKDSFSLSHVEGMSSNKFLEKNLSCKSENEISESCEPKYLPCSSNVNHINLTDVLRVKNETGERKCSTLHRYVKKNTAELASAFVESVDFSCESELEISRVSEPSREGTSVSSYDWVFKGQKVEQSSASSETLIDESSLSENEPKLFASEQAINTSMSDKRQTSSFSFPTSPKKYLKSKNRNCKSTVVSRTMYGCSSSEESDYETAPSQNGGCNSCSSQGSKYTMCRSRCDSSSSEDFAEIMKAFNKI